MTLVSFDIVSLFTKVPVVMYVIDNYDSALLYLHVEFFLVCMRMVLLPRVFHIWLTLRMLSVVVDLVLVIATT